MWETKLYVDGKDNIVNFPILQVEKLKLKEIVSLVSGHTQLASNKIRTSELSVTEPRKPILSLSPSKYCLGRSGK